MPSPALGGKMLLMTAATTFTNKATGKVVARQTAQVIYY